MQIVIDANILLAMLIRPGKPIDAFFNQRLEVYAPALLFAEFYRNKEEIREKSGLVGDDFNLLYEILKSNINVIPEGEFLQFRKKATEICPHQKDVVYFALALYLKCPLWSNEKKLKNQNEITIFATHELIAFLEM